MEVSGNLEIYLNNDIIGKSCSATDIEQELVHWEKSGTEFVDEFDCLFNNLLSIATRHLIESCFRPITARKYESLMVGFMTDQAFHDCIELKTERRLLHLELQELVRGECTELTILRGSYGRNLYSVLVETAQLVVGNFNDFRTHEPDPGDLVECVRRYEMMMAYQMGQVFKGTSIAVKIRDTFRARLREFCRRATDGTFLFLSYILF